MKHLDFCGPMIPVSQHRRSSVPDIKDIGIWRHHVQELGDGCGPVIHVPLKSSESAIKGIGIGSHHLKDLGDRCGPVMHVPTKEQRVRYEKHGNL